MTKRRNPQLRRQNILDAALKILREGRFLTRFSLDTVAAEAGVSKGGLIHHFPSKDALLLAVAQKVVDDFEARVMTNWEREPAREGRLLRAYIRAVFSDEGEQLAQVSPVLLSYTNGETGVGSRFDYWQGKLAADGVDEVTLTLVRMAVDGVLYTEMIDGRPIKRELRQQLKTRLLALMGD